jgi:hypothetical protein
MENGEWIMDNEFTVDGSWFSDFAVFWCDVESIYTPLHPLSRGEMRTVRI